MYYNLNFNHLCSLKRSPLTHYLTELPMGKYIVCGEAMVKVGYLLETYF